MPGLRLMCPICTEDFEESEEIYSTSCGHVYHLNCMQQWQSRATSCPQCRQHNPSSHKLYLILNDGIEESPSAPVEDLKTKLESSVEKIHELQAQVAESELNFMRLQEQYTIEQELRKHYDHRIAEFNHNEENFLNLHAQYSESEDRRKLLQEEIECLTIENEYKSEQLVLKSSEIKKIKKKLLGATHTLDEQVAESESKYLHLQVQFSESEKRLKGMQQENKRLVMDNEYKSKELVLQNKVISTLKERRKNNAKNVESSDITVITKVVTLTKQGKGMASELEKEITNNKIKS